MIFSGLKARVFGLEPRPLASFPVEFSGGEPAIPEKKRLPWTPAVRLSAENKADFGRRPLVATHNLHECGLFTDPALIELLDRFPRQHLYALSMGTDPGRIENRLALHDGVSGAELLRAVRETLEMRRSL